MDDLFRYNTLKKFLRVKLIVSETRYYINFKQADYITKMHRYTHYCDVAQTMAAEMACTWLFAVGKMVDALVAARDVHNCNIVISICLSFHQIYLTKF